MTDALIGPSRQDEAVRRNRLETLAISICRIKGWPEPDANTMNALLMEAVLPGPDVHADNADDDLLHLLCKALDPLRR